MPRERRMVKNCFLSCSLLILVGCGTTQDVLIRTEIKTCPPISITLECPNTPNKTIPLGERLNKLEEREECLLEWLALWQSGWDVCNAEN